MNELTLAEMQEVNGGGGRNLPGGYGDAVPISLFGGKLDPGGYGDAVPCGGLSGGVVGS